jgi:anti-sigma regulatory factor (Ser/Thr protein kinase)
VIDPASTVRLSLESRPQSVVLVRGMLTGIGELLSFDQELLDDLRTSASEACTNVAAHAYGGLPGAMDVRLYVDAERVRLIVSDRGSARGMFADRAAEAGVGISVMRTLARELRFGAGEDGGTVVEMEFAARRDGTALLHEPDPPAPEEPLAPPQLGELVVEVSPVTLLAGVLGRLARTLAASAHFTVDRFADLYLVTDTLAAHAASAAASRRLVVRLLASDRRLELVVGPFRPGTGSRLEVGMPDRPASPLVALTTDAAVEPVGDTEALRLVLVERRMRPR